MKILDVALADVKELFELAGVLLAPVILFLWRLEKRVSRLEWEAWDGVERRDKKPDRRARKD